jgi:catechol 2,3-dioxygenase-like lactoylglutathione lyase family enzyme
MITGIDHIVLLAHDIEQAAQIYETLLGVRPAWQTSGDGVATTIFTLPNTSLEIMAPSGGGTTAARVKARLDADGEGLASLCFRVSNIELYRKRLEQSGLAPEGVAASSSINMMDGASISWQRTRTNVNSAHGVRLFFLEPNSERPTSIPVADASVAALDRVVIVSSNAERAIALYGDSLGLNTQKVDVDPQHLDFQCGDCGIAIVLRTNGEPDDADQLFELVWRVEDIEAAHRRLTAAGLDVMSIRNARQPGTRAFAVNTGTLGVKTQIIQPSS